MKMVGSIVVLAVALIGNSVLGQETPESPFGINPSVVTNHGNVFVAVEIHVPDRHHIYSERLTFEIDGAAVVAQLPPTQRVMDKVSATERDVFEKDFVATLPFSSEITGAILTVNLQGCNESECFFPESHRWRISTGHQLVAVHDSSDAAPASLTEGSLTNGFRVVARSSGYLSPREFLGFLDQKVNASTANPDDLSSRLSKIGVTATVGLILVGGLALNLTPCVLPMIPINLAILGAGARHPNRRRGFGLGLAYGGGMALAYGGLGLVVVLTGSRFGALNSSAWFNFAVAAVFVILGLAMFDKLAIDFSRFQPTGNRRGSSRNAVLAAGAMGTFSALLAGACVAPVVISVLLLAATFYQKGSVLGLLLPFVLGIGMALPWPFAAAGLSFLPKPGAWMTRVKYGFGVIIFGFALWYGWLGWNLAGLGSRPQLASAKGNSEQVLRSALEQSRHDHKPVVVDFWASWCKNCEAMEHATFRNAAVQQRLAQDFHLVRFQAERLNDPALKPVLDQFGVMGLPTCVLLVPQ